MCPLQAEPTIQVLGGGNPEEMKDSFNELNRIKEKRQTHIGAESGSGIRETWLQSSALLLLNSKSYGKPFNLPKPQFPHLENCESNNSIHLRG